MGYTQKKYENRGLNNLTFDLKKTLHFLVELLNIPSPTGYHVEASAYVQAAFAALDLPHAQIEQTPKGALQILWRGEDSSQQRGVTAHMDTLGLMVKEIKSDGRLKLTPLGGFMWGAVEFEGVTVRTFTDQRYRGVVQPSNPSTHVNRELHKMERNEQNMEVRLDARTDSAAETRALGIEVGDFVFLDPRVEVNDGFIRSRHLDDKAGVACIYAALLALQEAHLRPAYDTVILIANYEEVGHGGSNGLPLNLDELLAVDMAAIGQGQNSDIYSTTICIKDSSGPYHFEMNNKLRRLAQAHQIPAKVDIYPYYASDGSAYWRAGGAGRVGLVGPGVEASHAYERTHQTSLQDTAHLIARYLLDRS